MSTNYGVLLVALREISAALHEHPCFMPDADDVELQDNGGDAAFITFLAQTADKAISDAEKLLCA